MINSCFSDIMLLKTIFKREGSPIVFLLQMKHKKIWEIKLPLKCQIISLS